MRLDDMERFVRAAEQREIDDDDDDEDLTGGDSGDDHIPTICHCSHADMCYIVTQTEHHGSTPDLAV